MEMLDIQLKPEVVAYLENGLEEISIDPTFFNMFAVMMGPVSCISERAHTDDGVGIGLYPNTEEKWIYAIQLPKHFLRVSRSLAESLKAGRQLRLRQVEGADGGTKREIFLV